MPIMLNRRDKKKGEAWCLHSSPVLVERGGGGRWGGEGGGGGGARM